MLLALYVLMIFAVFTPFSLLLRFILVRMGVNSVLQEIRELSERASKVSPKDKKMRMIRERYDALRRKLRNVFLINLFTLWIAIFTAVTLSNLALITLSTTYGITMGFRSPLRIPGLVMGEDQLNILLVVMAVIMAYQPVHNKLSTMEKVYEV
ncbi:MAG: hypothetical protein QXO98_01630 [Sulfolobales archaeon]